MKHAGVADAAVPGRPAVRTTLRLVAGILISVACVWLIVRRIDIEDTARAFSAFDWPYLVAGVVSLAAGYLLRIERWAALLRAAGASVTGRDCRAPFLASIALNNLLPFRAGDVVRAVVFPSAIGVQRITSTASLMLERLIDLLTLLGLLAVAMLIVDVNALPVWVEGTAMFLALASAAALAIIVLFGTRLAGVLDRARARRNRGFGATALQLIARLIRDALAMSRVSVLVTVVGLSIMLWCCEAGLFYFVLQGCSLDATMAAAVLAMAMATLATLVPSSPGYVGPFHLAAFSAAEMLGASASEAAVFAVISHLALWLPTTLVGVGALIANPQLFKRRKEPKDASVHSVEGKVRGP